MEISGLEFKNITDEKYRTYEWGDGSKITVLKPTLLHVSASGGHRVLDSDKVSHYIPSGWKHLFWEVYEDKPNFSF